jgi:hypothetical protein
VHAHAQDRAPVRQVIGEAIQIEDGRLQQLALAAEQVARLAQDLLQHVKSREAAAHAMDAKAND